MTDTTDRLAHAGDNWLKAKQEYDRAELLDRLDVEANQNAINQCDQHHWKVTGDHSHDLHMSFDGRLANEYYAAEEELFQAEIRHSKAYKREGTPR